MQANLKIKYMDGDSKSIDYEESFNAVGGNNVSDITALEKEDVGKTKGMKPFVLGVSKLGGGDKLIADKYCGFMSGTVQNGTSSRPWFWDIKISTIDGTDFDAFVILFDEIGLQWATELYVDPSDAELNSKSVPVEKIFYNDGPKFIWQGDKNTVHRIYITKWNIPNYPVRITGFIVGGYGEYNEKVIQELNRSSILIDNNQKPYYGITSGYATARLFDDGKFIADVAEAGAISRNSKCSLSIGGVADIDKISGLEALTGVSGVDMEIDTWEYSYSDSFVKIDMVDKIDKLHRLQYKGQNWIKESATALNLLNGIISEISSEDVILSKEIEHELNLYELKYYHFAKCTAYEVLSAICTLTQTILFTNGSGQLELVAIK